MTKKSSMWKEICVTFLCFGVGVWSIYDWTKNPETITFRDALRIPNGILGIVLGLINFIRMLL